MIKDIVDDVQGKIGFITCSDLSRYFVSSQNPLFTHDDQIACDYLASRGYEVKPVVWGTPLSELLDERFDLLVVRSPWDYMDSEQNRDAFFSWLKDLYDHGIQLANNYPVLRWSLDKHYLRDLKGIGIKVVPTIYCEALESAEVLFAAFEPWQHIVVKPCIAAAAKDAFLVVSETELIEFSKTFAKIRGGRAFMVQPFIGEIATEGEWSLVFLNQQYSHAVHKLPKAGSWLVQDELGGFVRSDDPPNDVRDFAEDAFAKLGSLLQLRFGPHSALLYARVDVLPGLHLGELELVEPELFFLDRKSNQPNKAALQKFCEGIEDYLPGPTSTMTSNPP